MIMIIIIQQGSKIQIHKMQQMATRQLLEQAREKFAAGDLNNAKTKLDQINQDDRSIQLNKLLVQFESCSQENCQVVLGKLMNLLTQANIELYKKNRPKQINNISHEMLYMNIIAIAEYLGKNTIAHLVGSQALFFYKILQTQSALYLIYQNMRRSVTQNRLSTSLQLFHKFQKIIEYCKVLTPHEQKLKIMITIVFVVVLLKLKMVEQSQALYMMKFDQTLENEKFANEERFTRTKRKNKIVYRDLRNFLKAKIDFVDKNYEKSIAAMLQYSASESSRQKIYAENNIAINFCMLGKPTVAEKIFMANSESLYKVISTSNKKYGTQVPDLIQKTKENVFLAYLLSREKMNSETHHNYESDQRCYQNLKCSEDMFSFKQQYRRGQSCLNLYHSILEKSSRKLPWEQIHDNYDNIYYQPNVPYYQFKGRNKNIHLANKKPVYKRYILNEWNDNPNEQQVDKDLHRRKFERQANYHKLNETLVKAQQCFRKSLLILQKEQLLIIRIENPEYSNMSKSINQKLYFEYTKFKSSILCLLAYVSLCLCKWTQVLKYCEEFLQKKCDQISQENKYSILTYQMEALSKLNRVEDAYKVMHSIATHGMTKTATVDCRDGQTSCNIQKNMTQQMNFLYNMSVLHSHCNRIPESHQVIQKLLTQLNISQNPKVEFPLSTQDLLIHYNLRTQNFHGALQIIKKRRMVVNNQIKPILNITK